MLLNRFKFFGPSRHMTACASANFRHDTNSILLGRDQLPIYLSKDLAKAVSLSVITFKLLELLLNFILKNFWSDLTKAK